MKIIVILQIIIFFSSNGYAGQRSPQDTLENYIVGEQVAWIGKRINVIGCNGHFDKSNKAVRVYKYIKPSTSKEFEFLTEKELIANLENENNLYALGNQARCESPPISKKDPIPTCYELVIGKLGKKYSYMGREIPLIESISHFSGSERCFYNYEK